jgi:hypothetical protein
MDFSTRNYMGLNIGNSRGVFYVVSPRYTLGSSQGIAHKMSIRTGKAWHIFLDTEKPVRRVKAD